MSMKTKLTLLRMDKDYKILDRREQWSQSWTRAMFELLYLYSARIAKAAPYIMTPVDLQSSFDASVVTDNSNAYTCETLRVATPGGFGSSWVHEGVDFPVVARFPFLLGSDVGICVGTDNTPVIPTDRRMGHKIGNGLGASDGAPATYAGYIAGEDGNSQSMYVNRWVTQPFFCTRDFRCSEVRVKVYRNNNPGNLTCEIRPMSMTAALVTTRPDPTTVLATGTILEADINPASPGDWETCTFGTPIDLYAGHTYLLVLHCAGGDAANYVIWRRDSATTDYDYAPTATYEGPAVMESTDGGVSYTEAGNRCQMFEVRGQSQGEFEYGGCEVSGITISAPSASFVIRRFFYNHSGGGISVEEVGILSSAWTHYTSGADDYDKNASLLIARDVVAPPIAAANTELLLVTYTPQITV